MPKNNLAARIKQWEIDVAGNKNGKIKLHKPGSQKR